jgi:DNA primase
MSSYVDFRDLKERISIEQAVAMLGLPLKRHGGQLRGCCPIHHGTTDREFVVTPAKGLFYCFGPCGGGDVITLVEKVKGVSSKQAAALLADHFGVASPSTPQARTGHDASPQPRRTDTSGEQGLQPLPYLQAEHELVQALGVTATTAAHFGAGYAPKGIMRGRLAIPVHGRDGMLLAYCGRAVRDETLTLTFPSGFDPASVIFNAERIVEGELNLVRDPLRVLTAHESGIDNVVAFLTAGISARQLEMLAALMDEKKCETVELF